MGYFSILVCSVFVFLLSLSEMARYGLKYCLEWQLQANNRFKSGQGCQRCRRLSDRGLASHEKESMKGGIPLSLRGDGKGAGEVFSNAFFLFR